jgi:hypothetical protein
MAPALAFWSISYSWLKRSCLSVRGAALNWITADVG